MSGIGHPRPFLTFSAGEISKQSQRRRAGDLEAPPASRAGGKPGEAEDACIPLGVSLPDRKLVKAAAGSLISGAWSSVSRVVGANGDR